MAQPVNQAVAPTIDEELPIADSFTLQIVSPSVGVNGPLSFPQLPVATTVKELKERIRQALTMRPADESQRLIHRGRLLAREAETMSEVFGQETLKNVETQTLHLVLRPVTADSIAPSVPTPTIEHRDRTFRIPPPPAPPAGLFTQNGGHGGLPTPPSRHADPSRPLHHIHNQLTNTQQAVQAVQQRLQSLAQEGERIQRELVAQQLRHNQQQAVLAGAFNSVASLGARTGLAANGSAPHNLLNQYHRDRAVMAGQVAQTRQGASVTRHNALQHNSMHAQHTRRPDQQTTYTREGTGPNGERWQITVNETTTVVPSVENPQSRPGLSAPVLTPNDLHTIIRGADIAATQPPGGPAVPAEGPGPVINPNLVIPPPPEIQIPRFSSRPSSEHQRTIPESTNVQPLTAPAVYILSSPAGPRALLIDNSQWYYTPRRVLEADQQARVDAALDALGVPPPRNRRDARAHRLARRHVEAQGQVQAGHPPAGVGMGEGRPIHPGNRNAGAVAQMWPHIWLVIRLLGFIWFFTSGNSSWWRWIMVTGLACVFLIINSGILNSVAEQVWGPVRRHLEALIPLEGPVRPGAENQRNQAVEGAAPEAEHVPGAPLAARREALDPAITAQRLLEQRRQADGSWLWVQIRRAEHAALLFLASLVPGVGERHIAARAAEASVAAEAARQRQEAMETAAADTAAADTASPQSGGQGADDSGATTVLEGDTAGAPESNAVTRPADDDTVPEAQPQRPLVEI